MVLVKKITAEETYFLRQEILRKNIDLPHTFDGDLDETTIHLGVFDDETLVCIGSFMKNDIEELKGKQYQLRGMATSSEARGKGYGKELLNFATNELRNLGINFLWCNAREVAIKFYEKNQFKIMGDKFVNKVGPHYKMYKSL
ncbi:GNAT family N-acetyltransferase [Tenacibaculum agarivorans]|uniref:GNAT family N-acetyltransferase n=1 Tax=Tenacibaculum agarivorans TaxID=1908389 RepID=UPI00094B8685|nr:GNAT family N-acetyltransferase [Tenacibaculum agarivorans]